MSLHILSNRSDQSPTENRSTHNVFALPAGLSGCAYWRYRLPLNKLKKIGTHLNITVADNPNKIIRMEDIRNHVKDADLISLQSPGAKDALMLMKMYKSEGKKVVVDFDDYSFDLSPGNPRYNELGIRETEILGEDGKIKWRWRDQENGFDLKSNIEKYEAFKKCVETADMVTTTTEYLAEKFRKHNHNVVICPNSIDFDRWRPISRPVEMVGQIRIGWFGGDSHYGDLKVFKTVFPRLCANYRNIKIIMQAPQVPEWEEFFKDVPRENIEWYAWADLRYYTLFLASRHFDIGLCPLEDTEFNKCKSAIKAFEFQALGAAVVAQNMLPYSIVVKHGETGLLAHTEQEWFDRISQLIEDEQLRNSLAFNGYKDVRANWDLDHNCRIWESAYTRLIEGEADSNLGSIGDGSLCGSSRSRS